ncbi:MAG: phosphatase PAP2 family protein, partial [Eubacterium sp.]|nr:phosphatase PAP2 family protein [Eubacterium sp.]
MIKAYKNNIILFYVVSAVALCFAAFFDLKIDIWLNNPENPICVWFYNTGEIPCRLIMPFAGTVILYNADRKWQKIAGLLVNLGGSAYMGTYIAKHFFVQENQLAFGIVYGIGFGVMLLLLGRLVEIPEKLRKPLFVLAVAGIVVMVVQLSCIEGMKYLWGRVRFRDLLANGSYDAFTPWYVLNGINGNKSFPSGHTAGAGMSYLLMLLPFVFDKFKDKKQFCFWLPCVFTSIVAFTRLVMGAHYLSDVTVGGIV